MGTSTIVPATDAAAPARWRAAPTALLVDLAAPPVLYYGLHLAGAPDLVAVPVGAAPPLLATLAGLVRHRRLESAGLLRAAAMLAGALVSAIGGGPRALLARNAWLTAFTGIWTLATLRGDRPLCFTVTRAVLPHRAAVLDRLWRADPEFRRAWRVIGVWWGTATLVDAALRVLMALRLPVASVPALDTALTVVTVVLLQVPTHLTLLRTGRWQEIFASRPAGPKQNRSA